MSKLGDELKNVNDQLMDLYSESQSKSQEAFKLADETLRALQMVQLILIDSDTSDHADDDDDDDDHKPVIGLDDKLMDEIESYDLSDKSIANIEKLIANAANQIPAIKSILAKSGQLKSRGLLDAAGAGIGLVGKGVGFVAGGALNVAGGAINVVGAAFNFMTEFTKTLYLRRDAIIEFIGNAVERYEKSGLIGLAEMLKPAITDLIESNEMAKNAATAFKDKLDLAEDGITILSQLTGGRFRPINAISQAVKGLDRVANLIRDTERPDDRNIIVSRLASILIKSKNSGITRVQRVLGKVCTSLDETN